MPVNLVRELKRMTYKILVITRCSDCTNIGKKDSDMICHGTDRKISNPDEIPGWCPLPDDADGSAGDV